MPADGSLEEQVRQRYHQPKGVEQFGIEPIPNRLKTARWFDLFLIVVNFLINPGTLGAAVVGTVLGAASAWPPSAGPFWASSST